MDYTVEFVSGNYSDWGDILLFVQFVDTAPLKQQIDEGYAFAGGWSDFEGFTVVTDQKTGAYALDYPGDTRLHERSRITRTHKDTGEVESLTIFPYSWVLWVKGDEQSIARIS